MDTVSIPAAVAARTEVFAADLVSVFHQHLPVIKMLSLDCFDTILWRNTDNPTDVFYNLQHQPAFQALGFTALLRIQAEYQARKIRFIKDDVDEVKLQDIYRASFPTLTDAEVDELTKAEMNEEMIACYAFPPVVALMRAAIARGVKIIIVSDTYFTEAQVRQLLTQHLPADVMVGINKIFCSCEHGKSKRLGLFKKILVTTNLPAKSILHIGDNPIADLRAPRALKIPAWHLRHHGHDVEQLLRLQTTTTNYFDPQIRHQRPMSSVFRGMFAANDFSKASAATLLGYMAVGPLLYAFAKFILADVAAMRAAGKNPKILFLLRDGYLPALVCEAIANDNVGHCVRISRFVAIAASFRTEQQVNRYLADVAQTLRFEEMAKQLLLPPQLAKKIIAKAMAAGNTSGMEFVRQIQQPAVLKVIFEQSIAYFGRLKKHLEKTANVAAGDTLVFVDLGYTGTAQILLEPVFRDEMQIEIVGRYLLAMRTPAWKTTRRGLLDPSWCDDRTLKTLTSYIALLEQICTSNDRSVVDFDDMGMPIFAMAGMSTTQHQNIHALQVECVRFARDAEVFFAGIPNLLTTTALQDAGLSHLSRLLFLPTQSELDYLSAIEFDVNMGTDDILQVFDQEAGLIGLRRRGLFFMERNAETMRTNYPAELRAAGMELSLFLMAQERFGLEIRQQELSLRREILPVMLLRGNESSKTTLAALPTHDGFFALLLPLGKGSFQVAVQFGLPYQWVQIDSAEILKAKALFKQNESAHTEDAWAKLVFDQMSEKDGRIFQCQTTAALMMFAMQAMADEYDYVLRVVFRPLCARPLTG
jgi:FMN phosphatase YigB (HAD superfamily)